MPTNFQWYSQQGNRPTYSMPSSHFHQTLLIKTLYEHSMMPHNVALVAASSKSLFNSSLAPNLLSLIPFGLDDRVDCAQQLFKNFFGFDYNNGENTTCGALNHTLQFTHTLQLISFRGLPILKTLLRTPSAAPQTKYFTKSLRNLTIDFMYNYRSIYDMEVKFFHLSNSTEDIDKKVEDDAYRGGAALYFPSSSLVSLEKLELINYLVYPHLSRKEKEEKEDDDDDDEKENEQISLLPPLHEILNELPNPNLQIKFKEIFLDKEMDLCEIIYPAALHVAKINRVSEIRSYPFDPKTTKIICNSEYMQDSLQCLDLGTDFEGFIDFDTLIPKLRNLKKLSLWRSCDGLTDALFNCNDDDENKPCFEVFALGYSDVNDELLHTLLHSHSRFSSSHLTTLQLSNSELENAVSVLRSLTLDNKYNSSLQSLDLSRNFKMANSLDAGLEQEVFEKKVIFKSLHTLRLARMGEEFTGRCFENLDQKLYCFPKLEILEL